MSSSLQKTGGNQTSYVVFFVKLLLVVIILFLLPQMVTGRAQPAGKKGRRRDDRHFTLNKVQCERENCGELLPEENSNCVLECLSLKCYQEIYGELEALEDGEIDVQRWRQFETCAKDQRREERKRVRREEREAKREANRETEIDYSLLED
mmetsp:Transcript_8047/g.11630  ORF Transcript_8047/g.11630 Transcript_8047/m.11630 type:complete len:151 (+) Transcript_8047:124-576(+)